MERGAQGVALHLLNYPKDHHVGKQGEHIALLMIDEEEEIFATTEELPLSRSSQPPKAKKKIEIS